MDRNLLFHKNVQLLSHRGFWEHWIPVALLFSFSQLQNLWLLICRCVSNYNHLVDLILIIDCLHKNFDSLISSPSTRSYFPQKDSKIFRSILKCWTLKKLLFSTIIISIDEYFYLNNLVNWFWFQNIINLYKTFVYNWANLC